MPMVRQAILQGDDTKIDLTRSDEQVREYMFEDIERQVEQATVLLFSFLPARLHVIESKGWSCSCLKQDELARRSHATCLCS